MPTKNARLSKLETIERERIAAEFNSVLTAATDAEMEYYFKATGDYFSHDLFDSLTNEELREIVNCQRNPDGSVPTIGELRAELNDLTALLSECRAGQMTANDSQ